MTSSLTISLSAREAVADLTVSSPAILSALTDLASQRKLTFYQIERDCHR